MLPLTKKRKKNWRCIDSQHIPTTKLYGAGFSAHPAAREQRAFGIGPRSGRGRAMPPANGSDRVTFS